MLRRRAETPEMARRGGGKTSRAAKRESLLCVRQGSPADGGRDGNEIVRCQPARGSMRGSRNGTQAILAVSGGQIMPLR
jgi:hypothetical protein